MTSCPPSSPPRPDIGPEPAGRYVFLLEGIESGDALLRLLGVVCVQQAQVLELRFHRSGERFDAKLDIAGLGVQRAEHLSRRLAGLAIVKDVSFGWSEA